MTIGLTTGLAAIQATPSRSYPTGAGTRLSGPTNRVTLSTEARVLQASEGGTWHFPPENAPSGVREAWAEATGNLSDMDRLQRLHQGGVEHDEAGVPGQGT